MLVPEFVGPLFHVMVPNCLPKTFNMSNLAMPERKHFFHEGFPKAFEEEKILLDSYIVTLLYLYTFIFFIFYFSNLCIVKFILLIHTFEYM